MVEDEERRDGARRSGRRDPARNLRRDPPVIEGKAQDLTPPVDPAPPAPPPLDPAPIEVAPIADTEATPGSVADAPSATHGTGPEVVPETASTEAATPADAVSSEPLPQSDTGPGDSRGVDDDTGRTGRQPWAAPLALGFLILAAGLLYLFYQLSSLPPDNTAAVADLKARLAALESRPAGGDTTGVSDRLGKLEGTTTDTRDRLDALGKQIDGSGAAASDATRQVVALQGEVTGLKSAVAALTGTVAALPRPDVDRIDARLGALEQKLSVLQGAVSSIPHVDLGPLTSKVDGLESRLKPIEAEVDAARSPGQAAQRRAAPIAVTAQAISSAIDAGRPFPSELQALQSLDADPSKTGVLKAVAEGGAPRLRDLQAGLADLRERIVTQGATPATGSYVDRLMAGATSLVQVRPLGSVVGDTPAAIVARMNDAIGRDDLTTALDDWRKLPEASRSVSKELADRIRLRLDAEQAAKAIASDAIGAMGAPKD